MQREFPFKDARRPINDGARMKSYIEKLDAAFFNLNEKQRIRKLYLPLNHRLIK